MCDLTEWVKESIKLDLIYDEEQNDLESNVEVFKKLLKKYQKKELNDPKFKIGDIPKLPKQNASPSVWFDHFLRLKIARIYNGLNLDSAQHECAKEAKKLDTTNKLNKTHNNATEIRKTRLGRLDEATRRCASAIDYLHTNRLRDKKSSDKRRKEWATLLALFNTELCACAPPELSLAAANELLHAKWLDEVEHGDVFQYTAHHLVATGMMHTQRPLDVTAKLRVKIPKIAECCKCNNSDFGDLLWRHLYFRASLTMADALSDLKRYAECRYYLEWALKNTKYISDPNANTCWEKTINLHLFLAKVDSGQKEKIDKDFEKIIDPLQLQPRLEALWHSVRCVPQVVQVEADWLDSELWNLGWHAAEPSQMAQRLERIFRIEAKDRLESVSGDVDIVAELLGNIRKLLRELLKTLKTEEEKFEGKVVEFLSKKLDRQDILKIGDLSERNLRRLWKLARYLSELLDDDRLKEHPSIKNQALVNGWLTDLKYNLRSAWESKIFDQVCSEVERLILFTHDLNPPKNRANCPNSPTGGKEPDGGDVKEKNEDDCDFNDGCACDFTKDPDDSEDSANSNDRLSWNFYQKTITDQYSGLCRFLEKRTDLKQGEEQKDSLPFEFISLQRWNSFSPNLGSRGTLTVGGGYFIRARIRPDEKHPYLGIAIDPGYNFLENLLNEGFSIADIDIIAITHAHPDHTENLTNLLTLVYERKKHHTNNDEPPPDRPILVTTEGVFHHFQKQLKSFESSLRDIVVLAKSQSKCKGDDCSESEHTGGDACSEPLYLWCEKKDKRGRPLRWHIGGDRNYENGSFIELRGAPAWHDDRTKYDSIGLIITYTQKKEDSTTHSRLGIMGDTRYHHELYPAYDNCDVLVTHLGSLVDLEDMKNPSSDRLRDLFKTTNHLYLPGFTRLLCDHLRSDKENIQKKTNLEENPNRAKNTTLFVLSEFGEELRSGLRTDIVRRTRDTFSKENCPEIIPADVGLRIDLKNQTILCCVCHRYVDPKIIEPMSVLPDIEALAYVCHDCRIARRDELPKLLEEWCQTARHLPSEEDRQLL